MTNTTISKISGGLLLEVRDEKNHTIDVRVYTHDAIREKKLPKKEITINWGGRGSVSIGDTEDMIDMLREAVRVAKIEQ